MRLLVAGRDAHSVKLASGGAHLGLQLPLTNPAMSPMSISDVSEDLLEEYLPRAVGLGAQSAPVGGASGGVPGHGGGEDLHAAHVPVIPHGLHHPVHDPLLVIGQLPLPQSPPVPTRDACHKTRDQEEE